MSTRDLVNAIIAGQAAEIETALNSTLMNKIADRLDDKRIEVASTMFNTSDKSNVHEALDKKDPIGRWIKDFQKSDAPQFAGKSKEKRREMAIAAALDAKRN